MTYRFPTEIPDRTYFEKLVSCREGCPVHTDARGYVQAVSRGDYELAYRIARGPNPFASICGRICGAPCETACRRGDIDEPVHIRAIKRTTTERHGVEIAKNPLHTLRASTAPGSLEPRPRNQKVACIGAGVGGMTAAHDLARLGYQVTVFEAGPEPGGMLRTGVPIFRLPREVWETEIEAICAMGVELKCNVKVGADVTIEELRSDGYEAILIAVGLQQSRLLGLPGSDLEGVVPGLELIDDFNAGRPRPPMGRVIVIGGGNVAYDCARSAVRLEGTDSVHLTCLEARHEMPADDIEVEEGDEEGIIRLNRRGPVRFVGDGTKVTGLETRAVARVFDEQGRFAPELIEDSEKITAADTVVMAVGQVGDTGFATGVPDLDLGRGGTVVADRDTGTTSIPWLFAVGDVALGPGLFIDAVGHAERAARSIHANLAGEDQAAADYARPEERDFVIEISREGMREDYLRLDRKPPPAEAVASRLEGQDIEVEHIFPDAAARREGARCLRCEVETVFDGTKCILCGGCADVCPTWCLRLVTLAEIGLDPEGSGASAIIKDEKLCVRCASCAERCPTDAITMERVCGFEPWTRFIPEGEETFRIGGKK